MVDTATAMSVARRRSVQGAARVWRFVRRDGLGALGVTIIVVMTLAAARAPGLAPYDPTAMSSAWPDG